MNCSKTPSMWMTWEKASVGSLRMANNSSAIRSKMHRIWITVVTVRINIDSILILTNLFYVFFNFNKLLNT